jgi:hypothetical protein
MMRCSPARIGVAPQTRNEMNWGIGTSLISNAAASAKVSTSPEKAEAARESDIPVDRGAAAAGALIASVRT